MNNTNFLKDNELIKVTSPDNETHYFTSQNRVAKNIGVEQGSVVWALYKKKDLKGHELEIVDGSDIQYRDIN